MRHIAPSRSSSVSSRLPCFSCSLTMLSMLVASLPTEAVRLVQLAHIVLQQLNALVLPTIFFFEPSAKLFVLGTRDRIIHKTSFPSRRKKRPSLSFLTKPERVL